MLDLAPYRNNTGDTPSKYNNSTSSYFHDIPPGIINDRTCKSYPNHAVTAVGYTRGAMIVRNSW